MIYTLAVIVFFILIFFSTMIYSLSNKKTEGFDATGLYLNVPSEWFIKDDYNPSDWIVNQYQDSIQPSCLSYSLGSKYGSLENLNYLKSATRFWRM
jgi:hypothetical protein